MICEEPDEELSRHEQLTMLLKASLSIENLREETAAKAQAFEKNYGKMVKAGFAAIIIIPLIFLILMFSLESKIDFPDTLDHIHHCDFCMADRCRIYT